MVHRTMGFPHKAKPKSAYRVIWVQNTFEKRSQLLEKL